jgi:2-iminoacetate synthase ThiH
MIKMIREVDRIPVERDSLYNEIVRDEIPEATPRVTVLPMAR